MNFNPVVWFEIYVEDMDRARKFYEHLLGITLHLMTDPTDESMQMYGFPSASSSDGSAPGASGALVQMEGIPSGGNSTLIYFYSQNCAIEEERAIDAGGKVFRKKTSIGEYGFMSLLEDTEGNMIGIHSMQ